MAETLCGSPLYMAPEILRYEKYDAKVDLWSIGAVLYEMAVGRPPFRAQNHVELLRKIEKGEDRIKFPDEKTSAEIQKDAAAGGGEPATPVDEDIKALIRKLLKKNPENRMPFQDLFESDVWKGYLVRASVMAPPPGPAELPSQTANSPDLGRRASQTERRTSSSSGQERRKTSEPRYYVAPTPTAPQTIATANSRKLLHASASRPIDIAPQDRPKLTGTQPITSSPLAEQTLPLVTRPGSTARRYSTLGRNNSTSTRPVFDTAADGSRHDSQPSLERSGEPVNAQGIMQDSEYVVVEKKAVEVNALADGK
jgi:serine/threonine-protein kinase ULK/ATG1